MAQNFRRILLSAVGTAEADAPDGANFSHYNTIIGINMANITTNAITGSCYLKKTISGSVVTFYIVKDAPIPSGGSLAINSKLIVESGDRLYFKSSVSSSMDVAVSFVQEIST